MENSSDRNYLFNLTTLSQRKIKPNKNYSNTILSLLPKQSSRKQSALKINPPDTIFNLETFLNNGLKELNQLQSQLKMQRRDADRYRDHQRPQRLQTSG